MKTSLSQTLCPECDEVLSVSDSVRLVGGSGLCSGSLQIWDQSWISVCEGALDLRGAEVLCRELGCRGPSVLQGELSPLGQTFHCEGHESALVDCPRSRPKTCPSGPSEDVICSEPLRLVGGASRCAGTVEVRHRGEWGRVEKDGVWTEEELAAVCRDLDCGSAVSGRHRDGFPDSPAWWISAVCMKRRKTKVRECVYDYTFSSSYGVEVMCSDLLNRPVLSLSVTVGASQVQDSQVQDSQVQDSQVQDSQVQDSQCSVKPQFPGGSFQLLSPSGNHTLPAVNHSAHFLFNHTGPAHKGNYTCVYHLQVFNHSFTSKSERLELRLGARINPGERAQRERSDPGERAQREGSDPGERAQRERSDPGERAQREGNDPGERAQREGSDPGERAQREGSDQVDTWWIPGGYQKRREEETDQERREEEMDQEERREEETDQERREEETDQERRREEETDQERREEETDQEERRREEETDQKRREEETDQERREEETDQKRREEETDQKRREEETDQERREEETDQERREEETDQERREEETDQERREEETDQERREEETDQKRREEETDQKRREEETDQKRREEETDQERREEETDQKRREEETDQTRREEGHILGLIYTGPCAVEAL
uniref:SRCR domain-containing protein n=1 Tax=Knipowitschia caucasica TaxID=637954 RepID=A0AAV2LJP0_KNICA